MSFTRAQHAFHYRPMVAEAWARHCRTGQAPPLVTDKLAHDHWYREQLVEALGVWTTKQCNAGKDFERAMAHFEALAGESITWQLRAEGGNARRLLHQIRELCQEHDLEEDYVRGALRQALQVETLPPIEDLQPKQLLLLLRALRKDAARLSHYAHARAATDQEGDPF